MVTYSTVTFERVPAYRERNGKCTACGKRVKRTYKVEHTINPFNKNTDGVPKSRDEVYKDVVAELTALVAKPLYHAKCELPLQREDSP